MQARAAACISDQENARSFPKPNQFNSTKQLNACCCN